MAFSNGRGGMTVRGTKIYESRLLGEDSASFQFSSRSEGKWVSMDDGGGLFYGWGGWVPLPFFTVSGNGKSAVPGPTAYVSFGFQGGHLLPF